MRSVCLEEHAGQLELLVEMLVQVDHVVHLEVDYEATVDRVGIGRTPLTSLLWRREQVHFDVLAVISAEFVTLSLRIILRYRLGLVAGQGLTRHSLGWVALVLIVVEMYVGDLRALIALRELILEVVSMALT